MSEDKKIVDLIGDQELKASETIQVLFRFAKLNLKAFNFVKIFKFWQMHCIQQSNDCFSFSCLSILPSNVPIKPEHQP